MTFLYQEPETPQLLQRTDSPIVGNGLVEREDISAGDSLTSPLPGSERCTAGPRTAEVAAITPLRSSDFDALATLASVPSCAVAATLRQLACGL